MTVAIVGKAERWRPSNGTGGDIFYSRWCEHCERERYPDSKPCGILTKTLIYRMDDKKYPKQWVRDDEGPKCLAFRERAKTSYRPRSNKIRDKAQQDLLP